MSVGLRGCQTETCFLLSLWCLIVSVSQVGSSSETWPKASYAYKAMVIHCHFYTYWLGCAHLLFLYAPQGFFQGTNRHTDCFHIRSHGSGLSGDAKQTENFVILLLPPTHTFHLLSFLCCFASQTSHLEIGHMIREREGAQWLYFGIFGACKILSMHWRKLQDAQDIW